ncbi:MAG: hypothetical protein WCQ59_09245 [Candidatus Cloacimonadaceae bacterium]
MKLGTKSAVQTTILDFSDFSGGLNILSAPENIAQNELSSCLNMDYSSQPGRLRTRRGIGGAIKTFTLDINGMTWFNGDLYVVADTKLWKITTANIITEVGDITGTEVPYFQEYDGKLYICVGSKIYQLSGATLTQITDSIATSIGLFTKDGRLGAWASSSDNIYASSVGDPSIWTIPSPVTASDPVEIQIGYKMAGNVVTVVPFLKDLVIFKQDMIMRLTGTLTDVQEVAEVARNESVVNKHCAINVGGLLFYIDSKTGIRMLEGVATYGDIIPTDVLPRINPWVRDNLTSNARIWHLKYRRMILFGMGNKYAVPAYYDYGIGNMPCLLWEMPGNLIDVVEPDADNLYVAVGKSVYNMKDEKDGSDWVSCSFETKRHLGYNNYLIKRIAVDVSTTSDNPTTQPVDIYCEDKKILSLVFGATESPAVYGNLDSVYTNTDAVKAVLVLTSEFTKYNTVRNKAIKVKFESDKGAPFVVDRFGLQVVPVGVI